MATTPNGYPYVEPSDHPVEFPAHSQQLATLLDSAHVPDAGGILMGSGSIPTGNSISTPIGNWTANDVWGGVAADALGVRIPITGWWLVTLQANCDHAGGGTLRGIWMNRPGGTYIPIGGQGVVGASMSGGGGIRVSGAAIWPLVAGNVLTTLARHDAGVNWNFFATVGVQLVRV